MKDTVAQKEFEQAVSVKCQQIPAEAESAWEYKWTSQSCR